MKARALLAILTTLFLSTCLLAFLAGAFLGPTAVALVFLSGLCYTFIQIAVLIGRE